MCILTAFSDNPQFTGYKLKFRHLPQAVQDLPLKNVQQKMLCE